MKFPVCKSVRVPVGHHAFEESVPVGHHTRGWAMVPGTVVFDLELTNADVRVYVILAKAERGGKCSVGLRWIAKSGGMDIKTVQTAIAHLIERGYLTREIGAAGRRAQYSLAGRSSGKKKVDEDSQQPAPRKELKVCPRCRKQCGGILKAGWCRSCNADVRLDRKVEVAVRRELAGERVAV